MTKKLTVEIYDDVLLKNLGRWLHYWTIEIVFRSPTLGLAESSLVRGGLLFHLIAVNQVLLHFICFCL